MRKRRSPWSHPASASTASTSIPPTTTWCFGCGESLAPISVATEDQIKQFIISHGKELGEYLVNMNKKKELTQGS